MEVSTLENVDEVAPAIFAQLETVAQRRALDWAMLMITNVIKEDSVLLATRYPKAEKALLYTMVSSGTYAMPNVLSRKKQLLPEILRVLEEGA